MNRAAYELVIFGALLASCCTANQGAIGGDLVNSAVNRQIDLTSQLAKFTTTITLENAGKTATTSFVLAIDPSLRDRLSFIGATTKDDEAEKLSVTQTTVPGRTTDVLFRVDLPKALGAGQSTTVNVEEAYTHAQTPYPAQITQAEDQLVLFKGNLHFYSPYKTQSETTTVKLASNKIESHTKTKAKVEDSSIVYGPFENVEAFSQEKLQIHYENNTPFLAVTSLVRVIEVSHWGNIAVEETYDVRHSGARLKGSFSRYDYQRQLDGRSSVKSFKTILPAAARDVYYRDEIGNISTSNLNEQDDAVELELRPRFPLFGGWKTHYYIGYNLPSYEYLYNSGDEYALQMRFVDHVYDDQVIDDITVKIILPEGSKNVDLSVPFPVDRHPDELHFTYLDTFGRPVVIAHKSNLVEQHIQDFTLRYSFQKLLLLQEPLLVVFAFYILFFTVIIYVRLDFAISKDEASESRMRMQGLLDQLQAAQDKRTSLYQRYEDAIAKFKSTKDLAGFTGSRKKIDAEHKELSSTIKELQGKLKLESTDMAEKVGELQKLDSNLKDQIVLSISLAEKVVAGKMGKQQYIDNEKVYSAKREDIMGKTETLLSSL
ncbi:PREDICTED: dolichyl-diphosphooligosaccharide--protein glycosyltransferase subunit 1-like [Branchiostoma belcheri]|uniref:Dolichyl-diphosphooligosaccharide--protein glycosyltransferase subunit 1 n=1 Tax=Branchiostoma belcheri TaxID=7741 RepID=A0A6P4ZBS4_BRABE|nr:PREDICTED: dolichyl-diphosphooligosaccharide--protein glycosyltransferase subunit 1-like [Branchiostoma belcheri]KAI8504255.1 proteasome regulatory particle base subunit [Branchiostoma belcheri]